jgi:NAD(P)-dependent dehydrogenase (short-subunit alcohol dehydrogenase family)
LPGSTSPPAAEIAFGTSASKFAVGGLSNALGKEFEPLGIRVTVVEPGGFRTDAVGRSLHQFGRPIANCAGTAGKRRELDSWKETANDAGYPS